MQKTMSFIYNIENNVYFSIERVMFLNSRFKPRIVSSEWHTCCNWKRRRKRITNLRKSDLFLVHGKRIKTESLNNVAVHKFQSGVGKKRRRRRIRFTGQRFAHPTDSQTVSLSDQKQFWTGYAEY